MELFNTLHCNSLKWFSDASAWTMPSSDVPSAVLWDRLLSTASDLCQPHVWECLHLERGSTQHQGGQSPHLEHVVFLNVKIMGQIEHSCFSSLWTIHEGNVNCPMAGPWFEAGDPRVSRGPHHPGCVCTPFPTQSHSVHTVNTGTDIINSITLTSKLRRVCFRAEF